MIVLDAFPKGALRNLAALVLVFGMALTLLSCSGGNPQKIAVEVAQTWTKDSTRAIATEIASRVPGAERPLIASLAASVIVDQIRDNITWSYSTPTRKAQDRYAVVTKAKSTINAKAPLVPDKIYDISVDFILDVDTKAAKVIDSQLDVASFSIKER